MVALLHVHQPEIFVLLRISLAAGRRQLYFLFMQIRFLCKEEKIYFWAAALIGGKVL